MQNLPKSAGFEVIGNKETSLANPTPHSSDQLLVSESPMEISSEKKKLKIVIENQKIIQSQIISASSEVIANLDFSWWNEQNRKNSSQKRQQAKIEENTDKISNPFDPDYSSPEQNS